MKAAIDFKVLALRAACFGFKAARWLLLACVGCMVVAGLAGGRKDLGKHPNLKKFVAWESSVEKPALEVLRAKVPTEVKGRDVSRWILGTGVFLLATLLGNACMTFGYKADRLKAPPADKTAASDALIAKLQQLQKGTLTRGDVLEIMSETKRTTERYKRSLAFLSIDVVDPIAMKRDEDPSVAERDFKRYKTLVDGILKESGAFKTAWTPDGVMICFVETRQAVLAGQRIVRAIPKFNREVKTLRADFAVRAGINAGDLLTHDSIPMEEMADRTIDIAGHMMKHGAPNAVSISEHAIKPLLEEFPFTPAGRQVDGCPVYEWRL
ncbi:MAG: hypothetical protein WC943_14375 [Elusimicrobiota bacterium]